MSDASPFERIVASLHEAAFDDTRWPATSALMDEAIGAKGNSIVFADESSPGDIRILLARFLYRGERREELEQEYFAEYYRLDERVPRVRRLPDQPDRPRHRPLHRGRAEALGRVQRRAVAGLRPGQSQRAARRPRGLAHCLGHQRPGRRQRLVGRSARPRPARPSHLRHYLSVRQALKEAGALGASLAALLDKTGSGVLHLDQHGRIVTANDVARNLLRRGDALSDEGGELRGPRERRRRGAAAPARARALAP